MPIEKENGVKRCADLQKVRPTRVSVLGCFLNVHTCLRMDVSGPSGPHSNRGSQVPARNAVLMALRIRRAVSNVVRHYITPARRVGDCLVGCCVSMIGGVYLSALSCIVGQGQARLDAVQAIQCSHLDFLGHVAD